MMFSRATDLIEQAPKGVVARLWLMVCMLGAIAVLMVGAPAAMANTVIEDWHEDGQIDGDYSPGQLQGALDSANPEEVEYSDLVEAIDQAMANALRKPGKGGGKGSTGGSKSNGGSGKGSSKGSSNGGGQAGDKKSGKSKANKKRNDDNAAGGDSNDTDSGDGGGSDLLDFDDSQADKSSGGGGKSTFKSVVADHPYLSGLVLISLLAIIAGLVRMFMLRAGAMPRYDGFLDD